MKYFFKMYFSDGTSKNITNSELKDQPLDYFDRYTLEGKLRALSKATIEQSHLSVVSTGVLCKPGNGHNPYEYPIIADDNFYFDDELFNSVYDGTTYVDGKARQARLINHDSELYQSMKEYLFYELENDSDNFLEMVYDCNNEFSRCMYRYAQDYKNSVDGDNSQELANSRRNVENLLSCYRNYRTLSTKRYLYEKKYIDIQTEEFEDIKTMSEEDYYARLTQIYNRENNEKVNEDKEEFIEPDEYSMMAGDDPDAVVLVGEGISR